jgi:Zn-finger nucleic acid-binding protein
MTCPICDSSLEHTVLLAADESGGDLRGFRCPRDHGVFLPSDLYFDWRDERKQTGNLDLAAVSDDVGDMRQAKLCPQDGRIMARYRSGSAAGFWIDRCGTCGGTWFDGSEWEATVSTGLHEALTNVFSDAWQREVEEAAVAAQRRERLAESVGESDLRRADEFREWVWSHPQRHLLLARVCERPRSGDRSASA